MGKNFEKGGKSFFPFSGKGNSAGEENSLKSEPSLEETMYSFAPPIFRGLIILTIELTMPLRGLKGSTFVI